MAASCDANSGIDITLDSSCTPARPMPIPNSAVMMGRPMARTEPKEISRMMMAATMPMSSLAPGGAWVANMNPDSSNWTPSARALSTTVAIRSAVGLSTSRPSTSNWMSA